MRRDRALLNTYAGLDDLEAKRQRALAQTEREARESERRISILERQASENKAEAEFYKKKALPPALKRRVDENEAALKAEKILLASKKDEVAQVNARFDEDRKRYIALTGPRSRRSRRAAPAGRRASAAAARGLPAIQFFACAVVAPVHRLVVPGQSGGQLDDVAVRVTEVDRSG